MSRALIVVGAGGFGREALDVVEAINRVNLTFHLLGVVDSSPSAENLARLAARGVSYLGGDESLITDREEVEFVVAIGSPSTRSSVTARLASAGNSAATLLHPSAVVGSAATIGEGVVVCSGVQISTNVSLGSHSHVNPNATIGHDSVIGAFASINPGAVVSGEVNIGEGALVGAGAVILQGLSIGANATVGAAACVVRDVPPATVVKGVPAR